MRPKGYGAGNIKPAFLIRVSFAAIESPPQRAYRPLSGAPRLDALDEDAASMDRLRGHSITCRIAIGRHAGEGGLERQARAPPRSSAAEHD